MNRPVLHLCEVGEPRADDAPPESSEPPTVPLAGRETLDVRADVIAGRAAGLSVEELTGIYGLDRAAVNQILGEAAPAEPARRSRWLSVVTGRRRRRLASGDAPHSAAG